MPQLVKNQLTILFEAGDYPSLGLQLHTHIMTGLWYFYYTIDLLSTFNILHHEIPLQHVLAIEDEQRMLQHLIALVTQLVPSSFLEQFHPPGFLVPPPARRQRVTELMNCVESLLNHLIRLEDIKENVFEMTREVADNEPNPMICGINFKGIIEALSLSLENLAYELNPQWNWDSMPSTPASEANDAEDDAFEATMDLDEALNILPPLRPHSA